MALVSPSSGAHWSRIRTRYATCRSVDRSTYEKSTQLLKCVWCFIIWRSEGCAATDRLCIVALSLVLAANKEARVDRALLIDLMLEAKRRIPRANFSIYGCFRLAQEVSWQLQKRTLCYFQALAVL